MDGARDLERCAEVTEFVLSHVLSALAEARVFLEGMVLKSNMIVSGEKCPRQASPEEVAAATVRVLKRRVPAAAPGIAFLSGRQSDVAAAVNLDAIDRSGGPRALTFSFGRALQDEALRAWAGKPENVLARRGVDGRTTRRRRPPDENLGSLGEPILGN